MSEERAASSAAGVRWDLGRIFIDAAAARTALGDAVRRAAALKEHATACQPHDAEALRALLDDASALAALRDELDESWGYAGLRLLGDGADEEARDLASACESELPAVRDALRTVSVAAGEVTLDAVVAELAPYRHWVERQQALRARRLHPEAETAFAARAPSATAAWGRLSRETLQSASVGFDDGDGERRWGMVELRLLRYDGRRDVRRRAADALRGIYEASLPVYAACLDAVVADRLVEDRLRGRDDPLEETLVADDVSRATVDVLLDAILSRTDILERWQERKRVALGLDRLEPYDLFAPVGEPPLVTWPEAVEVSRATVATLAQELAPLADAVFAERRVDAERRPRKDGAICCTPLPRSGSYVCTSHADTARGAIILAHELGHAVHWDRAAASTPWLALIESPSVAFLEIPSTLAELCAAEHLWVALGPEGGRAALRQTLEACFTSVFFVVASMRFEQELFEQRAAARPLTPERIDEAWLRCERALYGDLAQRLEIMRSPHLFWQRFYSYQYAYAALAALCLLAQRRQDPERFAADYVAMLDASGTATPARLLAQCGIDVDDPMVWERGLAELDRLCDLAW